jgi:very-short-patch-repair endonuclease
MNNVTNVGSWCPYCAHRKLCGEKGCNSCYEKSAASDERVKRCWSSKNKEEPHKIPKSSDKKWFFDCEECPHEFSATMGNVTNGGTWCPSCCNKSEKALREMLCDAYGANQVVSGRVKWCVNLDTGMMLPFDMILESHRIIIECDGDQHFRPVPFFNKAISFEGIWERDRYKEQRAIENGYSVVRVLQTDIHHGRNEWQKRVKEAIANIKKRNEWQKHPRVIKLYDTEQ